MKNKKYSFLLFVSFLIVGCDSSFGSVTLKDTKGNKYTFKNESMTCQSKLYISNQKFPKKFHEKSNSINCESSAIKEDIAGLRYVVSFEKEVCLGRDGKDFSKNVEDYDRFNRSIIRKAKFQCMAAKKLGKY